MTEAGTLVPPDAGSTESETAAVAGGPRPLSAKAVYVPASPGVTPTICEGRKWISCIHGPTIVCPEMQWI